MFAACLSQILIQTADQRPHYAQGCCHGCHAVLAGPGYIGPTQQEQFLMEQCQWCSRQFQPGRGQNDATDYQPAQVPQQQQQLEQPPAEGAAAWQPTAAAAVVISSSRAASKVAACSSSNNSSRQRATQCTVIHCKNVNSCPNKGQRPKNFLKNKR